MTLGRTLAPPRFLAFLALFAGGVAAWRTLAGGAWADALAVGFDGAAAVFLLSLVPLLRRHAPDAIRAAARANDANRALVLALTVIIVLVVLFAISGELPQAARGDPAALARLLGAIALAWLFANAVFALHYAHLFYAPTDEGGDTGGLCFPGDTAPDYGDFAYFAFTLGMAFQTSDVSVTARAMRRVVLAHALAAFVFNLGIVGLVINALAGQAG